MSLDKSSKQNIKLKASTQGFYSEPPRAYIQSLYLKPLPRFSIWSCYFNSLLKDIFRINLEPLFRISMQGLCLEPLSLCGTNVQNLYLESSVYGLHLGVPIQIHSIPPFGISLEFLYVNTLCTCSSQSLHLEPLVRVSI